MLELSDVFLLIMVGALGGFLSGMLGVGGGVIFVPVIDYILSRAGINEDLAVNIILANSIATIAFTGTISSIKQVRMGNFFPKQILYTSLPGVVTSLGLSYAISQMHFYSKDKFNVFFISMLVLLLVRMFWKNTSAAAGEKEPAQVKTSAYALTGFFTGLVTALSGLGGGIVMIPVFTNFLKLNIKIATSISTGVITVLVFPLIVYYLFTPVTLPVAVAWQTGHLIWSIILPLALGSFFLAPLGVKTSQKTDPAKIKIVFAIFVMAVLARMVVSLINK